MGLRALTTSQFHRTVSEIGEPFTTLLQLHQDLHNSITINHLSDWCGAYARYSLDVAWILPEPLWYEPQLRADPSWHNSLTYMFPIAIQVKRLAAVIANASIVEGVRLDEKRDANRGS